MPEEVSSSTTNEVKTTSDGRVDISVEKYNELLDTIANQKGSLRNLREELGNVRREPPVINQTVVEKTAEMLAAENRLWGGTFMGGGAALFIVGAWRYRKGLI